MRRARFLSIFLPCMLIGSSLPSSATAGAKRPKAELKAANAILGTWELAWPETRAHERELKLITPTHFTWTTWNVETHEVLATGGGPYTLVSGDYCEQISFARGQIESAAGNVLCYNVQVRSDSLIQTGRHPRNDGSVSREVWTRVR